MKVRILYRPVREVDLLEKDINNFIEMSHVTIQEIQLQASNHGVYAMVRYGD